MFAFLKGFLVFFLFTKRLLTIHCTWFCELLVIFLYIFWAFLNPCFLMIFSGVLKQIQELICSVFMELRGGEVGRCMCS